ncbi:MAG TPA: pyridoxamine 5'-phosphate oxidase family protein [Streptosporangiaceae bacterium]
MTGTNQAAERVPGQAMTVAEALALLGQVRFGRVVFTSHALPAVRPVRHVVADGEIVIAAGPELVLTALGGPSAPGSTAQTIVAYEADQLDPSGSEGWSVVVVGRARALSGDAENDWYRTLLPAISGPDQLVAISADVVTGFRLSGQP